MLKITIFKVNSIGRILLLCCSLIFSFILLVIGDWLLLKISHSHAELQCNKATSIIDSRIVDEDEPQKEKAVNNGFFPVLFPHYMDKLELDYPLIAGLPLTDTYYCNEGYGLIKYRSDRFGFRNKNENWDKPNPIIFLGDSFVHGACVPCDQTLPAIFAEKTNSVSLNLGMAGNSPSHYLTYAKLFIPKVLPQQVYLVFFSNDNGMNDTSELEKTYVIEGQKLFSPSELKLFDVKFFKQQGLQAINALRDLENTPQNFLQKLIYVFSNHLSLPLIRSLITAGDSGFSKTEEVLCSIDELCKSYASDLTVVYIPSSNFYSPDSRAEKYGDNIAYLSFKLDIPFIDCRDFLDRNEGSIDYAVKGPHLSPLGYNKLADVLISSNK